MTDMLAESSRSGADPDGPFIVAMATPPTIICPPWCRIPAEEHVADLRNQEGQCVHFSIDEDVPSLEGSSRLAIAATSLPDGTLTADPSDGLAEPTLYVDQSQMTLAQAEHFAHRILAKVAEARS